MDSAGNGRDRAKRSDSLRTDAMDSKASGTTHAEPAEDVSQAADAQAEFLKTVLRDTDGRALQCGRASAVTVADWDGDGDYDLIAGNIEGKLHLFTNVGKKKQPRFSSAEPLLASGEPAMVPGGDAGPFVADWDLDGKKDLIVGSGNGGIYFFRNVGSSKKPILTSSLQLINPHSFVQAADPESVGQRAKVCVNDWNEDGMPDLLVGDFASNSVGQRYHGYVWLFLRKEIERRTAKAPQAVAAQ